MKTPRTLPTSVAVAALIAVFATAAHADYLRFGSSFSLTKQKNISEDLTPAEKSRLSLDQIKAIAGRSLHRFTAEEQEKLKKCREYSHLKPESCDPMVVEANLADARTIIAAGLPESKRAAYEQLIQSGSVPKLDEYLAGIPLPVPATGAPVASKPQPTVGKPARKPKAPGAVAQKPLTEQPSSGQSPTPQEPSPVALTPEQTEAAKKSFPKFSGLTHDQRKKLCEELDPAEVASATTMGACGDILGNVAVATHKCFDLKDRKEQSACIAEIDTCQSEKTKNAKPSAPRSIDVNVAASCTSGNFGDELIANAGKKKPALTGKVPDIKSGKCEKADKDDKCIIKNSDPNEWLDVKAGVIGAVGGAVIGMLGGPVGILIGAAIGFTVLWGANKLLR